MGILDEMRGLAEEVPDLYPGSTRPILRHPNRKDDSERYVPDRWDSVKKTKRVLTVAGEPREFFTLGALADALHRKTVTLRAWERDKIIPNPTFIKRGQNKDERGTRRLYTREQIEGLAQIAEEEGLLKGDNRSITATEFTPRAFALFKRLQQEAA